MLPSPAPEEPLSALQEEFQVRGTTFTARGATLLHRLVSQGELAVLERRRDLLTPALLAATCAIRRPGFTCTEVTALWLACWTGQPAAISRLLLHHGADPDMLVQWTWDNGHTLQESPLAMAAGRGAVETVREVLGHGADPNAGEDSPLGRARSQEIKDLIRAAGGME
jgi:hypothetical protein